MTTAPAPGRLRTVLFSVVATSLVLGVLEAGARLYERFRADPFAASPVMMDPVLHHRLRPSVTVQDRERGITVTTNAQGWVQPYDVSKAKPPGVYRIFYLGDSNVQGLVPHDDKMTTVVGRELAKAYEGTGTRIEVINTGTASWSIMVYYLLVKTELLAYAPDLVVIDVDMTDVADDFIYGRFAVYDGDGVLMGLNPDLEGYAVTTPFGEAELPFAQRVKRTICRTSTFARLLDQTATRFLPAPPHADLTQVERGVRNQSANWLAREWTPAIEANVATSMRYLGLTLDLLHAHGVRALVTGVPNYGQYAHTYSVRPHEVLAATAAAHGTPYLDSYAALAPELAGSAQTDFYFSYDPFHLNAAGNRLWGKAQAAFLLAHRDQLLP